MTEAEWLACTHPHPMVWYTDRGLVVRGSVQFYLLFDASDRVARHVVRWVGTGL